MAEVGDELIGGERGGEQTWHAHKWEEGFLVSPSVPTVFKQEHGDATSGEEDR